MKNQILAFCCLFLALMSCENQDQNPVNESKVPDEINFVPAKTNGELESLTNDKTVNIVRNIEQFNALVQAKPELFKNLSQEDLTNFRGNLIFKNGGIAGLSFGKLKSKLSQENYIAIMARLGLDVANGFWPGASFASGARTSEDYKGYQCGLSAYCITNSEAICTSNCK